MVRIQMTHAPYLENHGTPYQLIVDGPPELRISENNRWIAEKNIEAKALEGRKIDFVTSGHPKTKEIAIMVGGGMFTGAVAGGVIGACVVEKDCAADKISYEEYLSQRDELGAKYRL
jgi:hypothetical protein